MRRIIHSSLAVASLSLLVGCTGTGLFLDHTFQAFERNPNAPAGNSQTMQRLRGEPIDIAPILPESGNVWPGPQKPDPTLDELTRQQAEAARRGVPPPPPATGATVPGGRSPTVSGPNVPPPPTVVTPNGNRSVVTGGGGGRNYQQLTAPTPGGTGILVPNGNGTSTLIGPNGSVQTVPTR